MGMVVAATAVDVSLFADPRRFLAGLEVLAYIDYSLAIKAGVHYTLCGGTICKLGTKVSCLDQPCLCLPAAVPDLSAFT